MISEVITLLQLLGSLTGLKIIRQFFNQSHLVRDLFPCFEQATDNSLEFWLVNHAVLVFQQPFENRPKCPILYLCVAFISAIYKEIILFFELKHNNFQRFQISVFKLRGLQKITRRPVGSIGWASSYCVRVQKPGCTNNQGLKITSANG